MKAITVEASQQQWHRELAKRSKQAVEYIPLSQALGRVLAQDLIAQSDMPPFRKSPYDGFVIPYVANQQRFKVIGLIGAGEVFEGPVAPGEAVRIMTGAPIPADCDTMIMQERCEFDGTYITVRGDIVRGDNIVPQGEECSIGETIIKAGTYLDAGVIAVAVGLGYATVPVYDPLKIVVLTSGREILPVGEPLTAGKIYNSNLYMLTNLLKEHSFYEVTTHHVSDDPAVLTEEIALVSKLSKAADVIISTGGVSVGLFDSMPAIYEALGARELYNRVLMRPGAASYGGLIERGAGQYTLCFGLSGNPTAAYNGFHLLVLPILRHCQGYGRSELMSISLPLGAPIHKKNPFDRYVQGVITYTADGAVFMPNRVFTSSALLGLAQANSLTKLEQGVNNYEVGDKVPVMLLKYYN
ncbi:molybdopterin molybdotransferase MoeA [Veillonella sp. R32]|uniref:molybdopterin molybdotransferase MoeA n=1 Tax=Veillonella sp. R32 TaxID=2021312 RepID=UPI001389E233|nr:molybdopterin molybdotransferase MoeA [Veillonella sp. R32]KAF1683510.1 molybdopterin molybdenumtransferase MoeA [Veillonella sp. R32]